MTNITDWSQSKYGFYVDRFYRSGKWHIEPGPIKLAQYHSDILKVCFTPDNLGRLPFDIIAMCEPAKSGKSALAGLIAEYVALHGDVNSSIIMASNKKDQASSLMFKSLTDSLDLNPHLSTIPNRLDVTFRNGSIVRAIPSNSRGEAGARFSLALFDELWAYNREDSQRLWSEFKTDPTRLNSLKFAVGYGGYQGESDLWQDLLNSGYGGQPVPELSHITNDDNQPEYQDRPTRRAGAFRPEPTL